MRSSDKIIALGAVAAAAWLLFRRRSSLSPVDLTSTDRLEPEWGHLTPEAESLFRDVLQELGEQGYAPVLYEVGRTPARQALLVAKGVSWTLNSHHLLDSDGSGATAIDVIDGRAHPDRTGQIVGWGSWSTDASVIGTTAGDYAAADMADEFFAAYGAALEARGLSWGGRWATPDKPHGELNV